LARTRAGSWAPTVVLEAGLAAEAEEWQPVFQAVSQMTAVCRYDRANRGASDPAPTPRTLHDLAGDLHALLINAAIPRPVVLVGHSLGGLVVRLYAHQHPQAVAGLVLVDPMHADQFERIGPQFHPPSPGEPAWLTQFRRFWTTGWRDPAQNLEGVDFVASQAQARAIDSLGDLPLLVLTAGAYLHDVPPGAAAQARAAQLQALWQVMHREIAGQSSTARQILVETSGHFVQRDQPEVIVAAIQQMLEIVRAGA
ncbi:MAG: alpha/beta hydrolase, partial [Anaerolineae bacterium]|nr:alpha/beta hydrolase [Anaerolineae bacterium]